MPGRMIQQSSGDDPFGDPRPTAGPGRETIWVVSLGGIFLAALIMIATTIYAASMRQDQTERVNEEQIVRSSLDILARTGAQLSVEPGGLRVHRNSNGIQPVDVETDPFPGFPTDLQAQFMALMTMANGTSHIRETIFENRYMHVAELARFGADISVDGQLATVRGKAQLKGAQVMATDLRASVSLVIAGLAAKGEAGNGAVEASVKERVKALCDRFPVYPGL